MRYNRLYLSGLWLIFLFILLRALNQVLFKQVALGPGGTDYMALLSDPVFYVACVVFIAQAVVWLIVLQRFALSFAYPFTGVLFITLLATGALFFEEPISLNNIIGSLLIMAGLVVAAGNKKITESG